MTERTLEPTPESYLARLERLFPDEPLPDAAPVQEPSGPPTSPAAVEPARASAPWPARLRQFTAEHLKVLSALVLAAVIVATWAVMRARTVPLDLPAAGPSWVEPATPAPGPKPTPTPQWLVHVVGAVAQPGVVSLPPGTRVIDAIRAAGGLTPEADPAALNLAAVLTDGCQVVIGTTADPAGEVRQGAGGAAATGLGVGAETVVNLNQATEAQLETLPGVGPVTAQAILAWREKSGPFTAVTQLQEVDGIGPKTYERLASQVSV